MKIPLLCSGDQDGRDGFQLFQIKTSHFMQSRLFLGGGFCAQCATKINIQIGKNFT
jgi:hypothetical protein